MSSSKIIFDGICKVQQSPSNGHLKKGMFSRTRETLAWKQRYCLISQLDSSGTDTAVATLTVYKSKKILRASDWHTAKVCCSLQLDSKLTVLSEDKLSNFVFHVDRDNSTISFSCDTKFNRDGWVSTITQCTAHALSTHFNTSALHSSALSSAQSEEDEHIMTDISIPEANKKVPPSLPPPIPHLQPPSPGCTTAKLSTGTIGGEYETLRIQLRRDQSLPTYSGGLELDIKDDKPTSKSSDKFAVATSANLSENQLGVSVSDEAREKIEGIVAASIEKEIRAGVLSEPPVMTMPSDEGRQSALRLGHPSPHLLPSATLPLKPPLKAALPNEESVGDCEMALGRKSRDTSGPMWMKCSTKEPSEQSLPVSTMAGKPMYRMIEKDINISTKLKKLDEKHGDELFYNSTARKEKQFGIPYSVFDFESLNKSQDFDELYPQLGMDKLSSPQSVPLSTRQTPGSTAATCTGPAQHPPDITSKDLVSVSIPLSLSVSGAQDDSLLSEVDQNHDIVPDMDLDHFPLSQEESAAMSPLQLQREVRSLVDINNELRAQLEQRSTEDRRRREQDHKLALNMQSEINDLHVSCRSLAEENNHLIDKMKTMTMDMKDLDMQCQEKERMCLKNESELESLESYRKLTESLTRDNTDLLCELDKLQVLVNKSMSNEESVSKEKKILLNQLQNSDIAQKKQLEKLREAETANARLLSENEQFKKDLADMTSAFRVSELELKTLRSRFDFEVLDEVSQETIKIMNLQTENDEYRRKTSECDKLESEIIRLKEELNDQSALVQQLSADVNVESVKKLTKAVTDVTVERDELKKRLSDKHNTLLEVESKLVDEQKHVFQLTMQTEELKEAKKRIECILEATQHDCNRKMEVLSANSSKVTSDFNDLMDRCTTYKAQLRNVEEEVRTEYESRLRERKEFNMTRLGLEDAIHREIVLGKKNQCRIEELEREQDFFKEKLQEQKAGADEIFAKRKELEESLDNKNSLLLVEQRRNTALETENSALQQDMEKLKANSAANVQELSSKIEDLEQKLLINKTKLQEAQQHIKDKKKDFKMNTMELNDRLQDADARCKAVADEVSKVEHARKRENEEAARELANSHERVKQLTSQLNQVNCALDLKSAEIASNMETISALQLVADNKKKIDKKLVETQLQLSQSAMEVVTLKDKIAFFEKTVQANLECIEKRDATVATLEENCRDLKSNVADLKHCRDQEENIKSQLAVENKRLQKCIEEGLFALNATELKLKTKISECDETILQLSRANIELQKKKDENVELDANVNSLRASLVSGDASLRLLKQENEALQGEVLSLMKKTDIIVSLQSKIEDDTEKNLALQRECDFLHAKVESLNTLKVDTDKRISVLESEVALVPELQSQLSVLSGINMEKITIEKKMGSLKERNHDLEKVISDFTTKELRLQEQIAELINQGTITRQIYDRKIKASEMALDRETSDGNLAFQTIQATVQCLLDKTGPADVIANDETSGSDYEDFDQWYEQVETTIGGKSATFSSYGRLLKAIVNLLSSSCKHFLGRFLELQPLLKKSNLQSWEAIEDAKRYIIKKGKKSLLLSIENINDVITPNNDDDVDVVEDVCGSNSNAHSSVLRSVDKMTECFEECVISINLRNTLLEALCRDYVCQCEERDALEVELQRGKAATYQNELEASKCKREKQGLERILRSKLSTQDFYEIVLKHAHADTFTSKTDLEQCSSIEEKDADREHECICPHALSPPHEINFSSSASLMSNLDEDEDGCVSSRDSNQHPRPHVRDHDESDDCASSVSWYSRDDSSPGAEKENMYSSQLGLRTGRAASVSLPKRRHVPDASKIADLFSADCELEF